MVDDSSSNAGQIRSTPASLLPADHPSQLSPDRLQRLRAAIEKCRKDFALAAGETASSHDATPAIDLAERRLVLAIQRVQKRARQKYLRKNPDLLAKFHVGHRLADNRANLEQFANNVLIQVESDPLPGLTKDALTELTAARDDWKAEMARQAIAGEALRQSILQQLDHILDERSAIQFAADDLWPHDDPKNVETRKKFYLPPDRPLTN